MNVAEQFFDLLLTKEQNVDQAMRTIRLVQLSGSYDSA